VVVSGGGDFFRGLVVICTGQKRKNGSSVNEDRVCFEKNGMFLRGSKEKSVFE
jgi:hypothetical protein